MKSTIYLDYNATTPVLPEVKEVVVFYLTEAFGNPSCNHIIGKQAKEGLERARAELASLIEAEPPEIIFVSGGTEANNLAILGSALAQDKKKHIITTQIEHPSVLNPMIRLLEMGFDVTFLPVDSQGYVDPDEVQKAIRPDTFLVSVMLVNNEIGTIQPVSEIGRLCCEKDVMFHTDAAQAVGKMPVSVKDLNCDLMTIAGHKMYAPKGIGALFLRKGLGLKPLFSGASQEGGLRPGTEPVALACGLGKAASMAKRDLLAEAQREFKLREKLYEGLKEIYPDLIRHGIPEKTLANTLSVSFPGLNASQILERMPELCASTGAACHDRAQAISHVLSAMGVSKEIALGTIRFSLGRNTTAQDIEKALALFKRTLAG
ncbi:cysteine desulfurase family protein [Thermodesulfatator autotrophicus]|uniref:cysteine desulfurase n=1 Tax=Thermodesulfatator autotrophicus TaxID=1795632 RepID=A0A177E6C8_9BACT|nr:cysteine desulfurase family protein [Thermodesulfatator autotrophicus]OAG27338.1 cysteine desulfurase NifS [Thermodesulfatator autotrophicus]